MALSRRSLITASAVAGAALISRSARAERMRLKITGIYVKVIAPYDDHVEGEELFLTGGNEIYFPRQEHAVIRQDGRILHQAVAIPKGSGRYVLDRLTGEVSLVRGPRMFLPDPRRQVLTRRLLTAKEKRLLAQEAPLPEPPAPREEPLAEDEPEGFTRPAYREPRSITLADVAGAVRVQVRSGYAVQIVDRGGARRVVLGPASELLEYDETIESLRLSSGIPKRNDRRVETAHLRVTGNEVSDQMRVASSDLVNAHLRLKYRVSFEGDDPSRWFAVEDYVELLADHARSKLQAALRRVSIQAMRDHVSDLVRDALLGARDEDGQRPGLQFEENGMRVFDVEVLDLDIKDAVVDDLLAEAQFNAIQNAVTLAEREAALMHERRQQEIERALLAARQETELLRIEMEDQSVQARRAQALRDATLELEVRTKRLEVERRVHEAELASKTELQALSLAELEARVQGNVRQAQAFSPHLVTAIDRLADERLLSALAVNFSELAAVEGRGLLETARKFLDFMPNTALPVLAKKNGASES